MCVCVRGCGEAHVRMYVRLNQGHRKYSTDLQYILNIHVFVSVGFYLLLISF